jgi:hypothetical protein
MLIKDLAVSKELDCKEMASVHGGMNTNSSVQANGIQQGGLTQLGLGGGIGSPVIGVNAPVAVATNTNSTSQFDFSSFRFPGLGK